MEKTIKKELERPIIGFELLNENSLLLITKDVAPSISIRYIDNGCIKEDRIGILTDKTTIEYNERMVAVKRIGQDNSSLLSVYDLEYHMFVEADMQELIYNNYGNSKDGVKTLAKVFSN